ncbi:hypothetical protein Tco_1305131 [Tanacetum coccineum]
MVLLPSGFLESLYPGVMDMINNHDIEHIISPTQPDYPLDESIFAELDNSLWIISRPLGSEQSSRNLMSLMLVRVSISGIFRFQNFPLYPATIAPKRKSTSAAPAMTQASIRKLVDDSVVTALEAQAATLANTDNINRNTREGETLIARKCSYKELMSCQPSYLKGTERAVGLIHWFERIESVFLHSNCTKDSKVKFATGTLTEDALSCLTVKGNDLKTYVRRFQELAVLCPTMIPNAGKLMEVFIRGLPQSIEGNVTASKPQTLEEATTIAQRLMD